MQIYDQLWNEAATALEHGQPKLDPHLLDKASDLRRGISLMFDLPAQVQGRIKDFLDKLAEEFPGQYFYQPQEFHVTIVTFVPASEFWRKEIRDVAAFRQILVDVLSRHPSFDVEFRGVTVSPSAVIVQGFPRDQTLEYIRRDLRQEFVKRGFPNRLDRRYANESAHATVMRFCNPDSNWKRLLEVVAANRQTNFGEMRVDALHITWGDWYASTGKFRVLQTFPLAAADKP